MNATTEKTDMRESSVHPTVDFDGDGVRHGFLQLPHSDDRSAWGSILIPVTVVKNGEGPTALLTGGNHGDEYEGVTALLKLARELEPRAVCGRVIVVPCMNPPAVIAGTRTSPIDGGNMNRAFPGRPDGSATEKIADYFQRYLIPLSDYALDLHSGGATLDFLPMAVVHRLDDPEQQARCQAAMRAFGAPYEVVLLELDPHGLYDTAVEAQGKVFVSTELGGGATSTPRTLAVAERGVRNFLMHAGVLGGEPEPPKEPATSLAMPDHSCYVMSEDEGVLELCKELGDAVEDGEVVARVHDPRRTGAEPAVYRAKRRGLLAGRRHLSRVGMGDTVAVIGEVV